MARVPFRLPDIGEGIAEAEIVAWHAEIGDRIEEDAPLCDLMTDKATVEMTSPIAGRLVERAGEPGQTVAIGSPLAWFETDAPLAADRAQEAAPGATAAAPEQRPAATPAANHHRVLASPAVRARARDLGVDLAAVRPAQGDRVRHADLDAFLRYAQPGTAPAAADVVEEVRLVGLRRRIAEHMMEAARAIPHFAYVEEVDVTALEATRAALNDRSGERPRLTLLPFLIRAITRTLADFPMINARFDDEASIVRQHSSVHLGVATQTDAGLMVPVIRDAQARDLWQLAAEIKRLADLTRAGRAPREALIGSTITLTSLGALGGIASTPIINRPEVAIVGVNRIVERAAVVDGQITIRKLMNLSSSFDHRVVDGYDAARFVQGIKRLIETPALLFVDG
ncbi:MAG: hypothetical protein JWM38_1746 [Sphingomonas bacterium]|nr:hypothetical protein [Sphingomonas bacterium]